MKYKVWVQYGYEKENPQYEETFEASGCETFAEAFEYADHHAPSNVPLLGCFIERCED